MNKSAIKNFAVRARNKLIEDVTQKAFEVGITKDEIKGIETFEGGFKIKGVVNSKIFKKYEAKQREKLVAKIKEKEFKQVIEEVAYTWFNRFIALRFMEVNEYLPTGVRVLSSKEEGKTEPDIIKEALNIDLDIDKDIVYKLIDENETEDLFKYLLIKQCNQLGQIMPMVFEKISDYTELLLPDNLLAEGSIIRDLVDSIEEEDYRDQVEIIGWLYQYYISEKKDEVFADLKKNKKINKENIPAATQLFTPKWIVKYMVENSLGRLWLESHPDEELKAKWKYFLEKAEQDPGVQKKLDELKKPDLNPEEIKVLDPAMGSGHILVYAFDVLYDIYLRANYSERDIPQLILEKNLYGLDIDDRAGQLAAFALMMKARSKSRRIFRKKIDLNICSIQESNGISREAQQYIIRFNDLLHKEDLDYLVKIFNNAKEYGSILDVNKINFDAIEDKLEKIKNSGVLNLFELQYKEDILEKLPPLIKQARIISEKYDVVCTNPPYMGIRNMGSTLSDYLKTHYTSSKNDMFSVFIEKGFNLTKKNGFNAMVTMQSWMFLSSFQPFRENILLDNNIWMLVHMGNNVMGIAFGTSATVFRKFKSTKYRAQYNYIDIKDINNNGYPVDFPSQKRKSGICCLEDFKNICEYQIVYWMSPTMRNIFNNSKQLKELAEVKQGITTSDNNRFLRYWHEINYQKLGIGLNKQDAKNSKFKWFPYNKGGSFQKWYGNNEYVINYESDGKELKDFHEILNKTSPGGRLKNKEYYFLEGLTWSKVTNGEFSIRFMPKGTLFDVAGSCIFPPKDKFNFIFGLLNSKVVKTILDLISPTVNYEAIQISSLPYIYKDETKIDNIVKDCVYLARRDWDSFELSWDFIYHPLLKFSLDKNSLESVKIEIALNKWNNNVKSHFEKLKESEEQLNKIYIEIYGLQDELTPEIEDKDITISNVDKGRDIKSFISYSVGCMFGRYSLDEEGLIYAGGKFDHGRYKTYIPTKDNILVIADDDYFEDDIVNRFIDFVKVAFGEKTLEENLDFIADVLEKKSNETSRQAIRRYFLKDFYNDHIKTYSKRPIYWLFDSGKQNGFKALIYMHRYDSSTVARVRTDYLHKLQKMYEAEEKRLDSLIESEVSAREKAAAMKKRDSINIQIAECLAYDQVIAHVANQKIEIDLDDGVAVNYEKFQGVLIPQGEGKKPLKANLLAKI